jgi:hypothetical protein
LNVLDFDDFVESLDSERELDHVKLKEILLDIKNKIESILE